MGREKTCDKKETPRRYVHRRGCSLSYQQGGHKCKDNTHVIHWIVHTYASTDHYGSRLLQINTVSLPSSLLALDVCPSQVHPFPPPAVLCCPSAPPWPPLQLPPLRHACLSYVHNRDTRALQTQNSKYVQQKQDHTKLELLLPQHVTAYVQPSSQARITQNWSCCYLSMLLLMCSLPAKQGENKMSIQYRGTSL